MTGSERINRGEKFKRSDKATATELETPMTKLGQVGDAYGEASVLWNRLEHPGDYALAGEPRPKNLRDIIMSKGRFASLRDYRYKEAMSANVSDPQAYKLAREAVEYTARYGPLFNFDSNQASQITGTYKYRDLEQGRVNMGSGNDFWRQRKP
jgi:hypothetical protein